MSDTESVGLSNDETKNQRETASSLEKSSTSESSCMLDSFSLRYRQENGSPALDDNTGVDKLVTNFSSSRWGVGISSGTPSSSLAASTSPEARPPTWTIPLPPKAGLLAPSNSASLTAGPSVPDVATSSKSGPSDLDDSSPKAGSPLQDTPESTNLNQSILFRLLSPKKPSTSIGTESSTAPTSTSTDATPLETESSAESKLVIFSPTIRKATHNWKNHVVSVRMQNSFTAAKSALESGRKFHHDLKNKPYVEQHKVRRFRTTDRKSSEKVSQVSQTSSQSDRISPSVSASASSTVGCIPRNTGKQFFDSLRSFLPQWIFIQKVPPQEPESSSVSPVQKKLLNAAFNRQLFENEKKQQTGLVMSIDQPSPLCGAGESVPEISPSADETQQSSPNEDKVSLKEKAEVEDDEKSIYTEEMREKRNTERKLTKRNQ